MSRRGSSEVLIGRRSEVASLHAAFERARSGDPSLVLVAGEAGIGKTRLVDELTTAAEAEGAWAATGPCLDLGQDAIPYAPFVSMLRLLHRRLDPADRIAIFGPRTDDLRPILPDLGRVRGPDRSDQAADHGRRLAGLLDGVLETVGRIAVDRPLVLVIEDLHWADGSSRDLLRFLVRNLRTERILLVATLRSDELHRQHPLMPTLSELERAPRVERIDLRRFGVEEVAEQLAAVTGRLPTEAVVAAVLRRSDGNPFYIEELAASDDPSTTAIPPTLRDILGQRLGHLSSDALEMVHIVAVSGGWMEHERLVAVGSRSDEAVIAAVREAIDQRVLVPFDHIDGAGYTFRHALVQEAAYEDLLPAERVRIHARLADHLEALLADMPEADAGLISDLALHAYRAHDQARALIAAVRAVKAHMTAAAYREALVHAERALELWPRIPDAAERTGLERDDLESIAASAAANVGQTARALDFARAAVASPDADDPDPERRAGRLHDMWVIAFEADAMDVATDVADRALAIVRPMHDSTIKAQILGVVGNDLWTRGRHLESNVYVEEAMRVASAIGDDRAWAVFAGSLAHTLAEALGRGGRADTLVDAVLRIDHPFDVSVGPYWRVVDLVQAMSVIGRWTEAIELTRAATEAARRYGVEARFGPWLDAADPMVEAGRYDEVEAYLDLVVRTQLADHPFISSGSVATRCHVARGRVEAARAVLDGWPEPSRSGPWFLEGKVLVGRAEHRLDVVREAVADALSQQPGEVIDGPLWCILGAAIGAAADEAIALRRRRGSAQAATVIADGNAWLSALRDLRATIDADGGAGPFLEAIRVMAEAEFLRATATPSVDAWRDATDRFSALGHPLNSAYARFRMAEALLDVGEATEAAEGLRAAHAGAEAIGARALVADIERLAARARVPLSMPVAEPTTDLVPAGKTLTDRERTVLALVAEGHTNREIGDQLYISEKTVSVHVSNAMAKLGALSRYEAAAVATRDGLL